MRLEIGENINIKKYRHQYLTRLKDIVLLVVSSAKNQQLFPRHVTYVKHQNGIHIPPKYQIFIK